MERGQKGKGKRTRPQRLKIFLEEEFKSHLAEEREDAWQPWDWRDAGWDDDPWSWQGPAAEESCAAKGRRKKGRKRKCRGKWSSKNGKANGGKDNYANAATEAPQPSNSCSAW